MKLKCRSKKIKATCLGVLAVIGLLMASNWSFSGEAKKVVLNISGNNYTLLTAGTFSERRKGLSNIRELRNADGMIFYFNPPQRTAFWNKDTHMDLDLIWFSKGKITGRDFLPSEDKAGRISVNSPSEVDAVVELVRSNP